MDNIQKIVRSLISEQPTSTQKHLKKCMEEGFHPNLLAAANSLAAHNPRGKAYDILRSMGDAYSRPVQDREINDALDKAYEVTPADASCRKKQPPKTGQEKRHKGSKPDLALQAEIIARSPLSSLEQLGEKWGRENMPTATILSDLFDEDDYIVLGQSSKANKSKRLKEWLHGNKRIETFQFYVPAVMKGEYGLTQQGKQSGRCKDNVLERRLLVIESDQEDLSLLDQAKILDHLARFAPMKYVTYSGGKSLHGAFVAKGQSEDELREFMDYAVQLGADKALFTTCQFARTPGATRDNGEKQKVIVYRPKSSIDLNSWRLDLLRQEIANRKLGYYDSPKKSYLFKNEGQRWLPLNLQAARRWLKSKGLSGQADGGLSEIDQALFDMENTRDVVYAAPLSGHYEGFYERGGIRYLVTDSPKVIPPQEKPFPTIQAIFECLFSQSEPIHGNAQLETLYSWLKLSIEALRSGRARDAQALAIAGEAGCGKSFLQHKILTPCLGGRSAKGARYMMGKTEFNGDLFEAEHIVLEDEMMSHKMADRLALAANIKKFTVSTNSESLHKKGRDAISITPWWRVSISLNSNPESLLVLPPLNDDVRDKIIILKGTKNEFPMPTDTDRQRELFREKIENELPGFIWWLLNEFQIPEELLCSRYGCKTWQHPEIVSELSLMTPEQQLWELVQKALKMERLTKWKGSGAALKEMLVMLPSPHGRDAEKLLSWSNAVGTYLARLEEPHQGCVVGAGRKNNIRQWVIKLDP